MIAPAANQISSLLTLINESARTLQAAYINGSGYVPSLDDTGSHPLDGKLSAPELKEAVQVLEGACAQLCATLARPNHTVLNKFFLTALEPNCLRVALMFKIPDILQEKPSGMHISEISHRCGTDPAKLARVLRLLSAKHCFREVERDTFANNRLSVQLLASNPLYSLGLHMTGDTTAGATKLAETLADPEWAPFFRTSPLGMEQSHWPTNGHNPDMHAHGECFGIGMIGWGTAVEAAAVVNVYPWSKLGPGATVCAILAELKLQDLPDRMVQAENEVWPVECPEAIAENRIEFKAIDFFTESPIAGCDVYYLKNILHAFSTSRCLTILQGIRKSMKPGSRVLIHEYILQTADSRDEPSDRRPQLKKAPAPLLPNYGEGRIRQYHLDVSLMVLVNSQERTLDEYVQLGEQAGLKFLKLWEFGDLSGVELCANEDQ
ncbi:3-O-methyltransferase 2 [Mycena sanguinolenta]|uniref:3-O-methyltransferase 2 n=1 Tax=Mycena sanguinolenta TaxID=230812 RepID=A0A8H6Y000_9AGAR|nr:3-O-methyltransferase 2 [Mycena sanguinolenta]